MMKASKKEMKELIDDFLKFAGHLYDSRLYEQVGFDDVQALVESFEIDQIIDHFLEGD